MGLYTNFVMALSRSKAAVPLVHNVIVPIDRRVFKLTKGRMSLMHLGTSLNRNALHDLLLTTTGKRSGKQRSTPVLFLDHDDGYVIVGSRYGTDSHPHWTANLLAKPEATVLVRGIVTMARGKDITGHVTNTDLTKALYLLLERLDSGEIAFDRLCLRDDGGLALDAGVYRWLIGYQPRWLTVGFPGQDDFAVVLMAWSTSAELGRITSSSTGA